MDYGLNCVNDKFTLIVSVILYLIIPVGKTYPLMSEWDDNALSSFIYNLYAMEQDS